MPFYLRKAFKSGPIRFNLSKGGVGISAGVTGARLGLNRRGTYVHGGRHGMYYRKHLKAASKNSGRAIGAGLTLGSDDFEGFDGSESFDGFKGASNESSGRFTGTSFDHFIDTGVTYTSAINDLPERPLPSSPKPGSFRSRRALILSILFIAFSIIYVPNALFVGVFLPFAVIIYDRKQHQKFMNAALDFMSFFRDWIENEAQKPESVDSEALKNRLIQFKSEVPENYHPQFLQRWYIMLLEGVIEMAWHEVDWQDVIRELESEFDLSEEALREIKISLFRTELETALEDHLLSKEEERLLLRIGGVFGLVAERHLVAESELMNMAKIVREEIEKSLEAVDSPIPLVRGETAFGLFEPVRLLNERVLNRYQRDGVTHRELGYHTEIDAAQVVLTDRRLVIIGNSGDASASASREYRLNKVVDVVVDPARSLVEISLTDRKSALIFTTPDCLLMGARIEKVIEEMS